MKLSSGAKLPSGNAAFALTLDARLRLHAIEQKAGRTRVVAQMENPSMRLGGKADAEASRISEELARPILLEIEGGRVVDSWFAASSSGVIVSTWRSVLGALQLSEPTDAAASWTADEYDSAGRYQATYTKEADGSVLRKKVAYVALLDVNHLKPVTPNTFKPEVLRSETRFVVRDRLLRSAQQSDSIRTPLPDRSSLTVDTEIKLDSLSETGPAPVLDTAKFLASALNISPDRPAPAPRESAASEFDNLKMEGKKFSELVSFFEQNADEVAEKADLKDRKTPEPEALRRRTEAFSSLAAFLRSDPAAVPEAVRRIRAGSKASPILVSGLSSAATPAAQEALLAVLGDAALPSTLRARVLLGLGMLQRPDSRVVPAVIAQLAAPKIRGQALLSLGSLSRRLRDAGRDAEVAVIRPELERMLVQAKAGEERELALRAIANSGDAKLFPLLSPYLVDAAARGERAAAAEALLHMPLPDVDRILAQRLTAETDAETALAILRTMRTRGASPDLLQAVKKAVESGMTPNVRQSAVELARSWAKAHPTLHSVLAAAAENDPDPQVRKTAANPI